MARKGWRSFVVALLILLPATSSWAAPRIGSERAVYDFGTIRQGGKVEHVFTIQNLGDSPLKISEVRSSCGCTAVSLASHSIAPGRSGQIKAAFDSSSFNGQVEKTVYVHSNDPAAPVFTLAIKGKVVEPLAIAPRPADFGLVKIGSRKQLKLAVTNNTERPVNITGGRSASSQLTVRVTPRLLKPGESLEFEVTAAPKAGDRLLSGFAVLTTDMPGRTELSIPVQGTLIR